MTFAPFQSASPADDAAGSGRSLAMGLAVSPIGHEALDNGDGDPRLVSATLHDIARVNAWLGGRAAAAFGLRVLLRSVPRGRRLTLLDVGAGSGDIARHLVLLASRLGAEIAPLAVERHPVAAALCRRSGCATALADGGQLPFADRSVDIVVASQLFHHLARSSAARLAGELDRVGRVGVIVADLRRARAAAFGIWLASYAMRLHRVTRRDAVTSVRRGFTREELRAVLQAAGIAGQVYRRPGYRLVAVWRT